MELWGGVECTVNRVGDRFRDQLRLTGHHDRIGDLDVIAALGVRRLRYPVLWERVAPRLPDERDWTWSDARLERIRTLGMMPIVGLLHHGSGPAYTNLLDDNFAGLFARYAGAVARRYAWVDDWTPINEPLTTARFSALYGHWFPHARDERSFYVALLNQIDATQAAMIAIREVNPAARLIQTDDLGETFSTQSLAGIADYLNNRRWLTWDLLCGRVDSSHPMWREIARHGLDDRLRAIGDRPCVPDVIGINHYVTSDRFLDDRLDARGTPLPEAGYHDLCAARVLDPPLAGPGRSLRAAWKRYDIPVVLTELHLGCTREEQVRWLWQAWRECCVLADDGVDVAGFTPWAMFGAVDWSSLLTRDDGPYECGIFDVRSGVPRPTVLAAEIRKFAAGLDPAHPHPAVAGPGWWQRPERLEHPPYMHAGAATSRQPLAQSARRPILITGATGTLGRAFARACEERGLEHVLTDRATLAIHDSAHCEQALARHRPWLVVNAAGWVRVDDAETSSADCWSANADGPAILARACAQCDVRFVTFSSDLVFGGDRACYVETDTRNPLSTYGRSKADAEDRVSTEHPDALIVRAAAFFSPHDEHNFAVAVERELRAGRDFLASARHSVSPTYVPHLVAATLDLAIDGESGIWHLSNGDGVTWLDFARLIAEQLELDADLIRPATKADLGWIAPRPMNACLATSRGEIMPPLHVALSDHCFTRIAMGAA